jgi:hypothetical protein
MEQNQAGLAAFVEFASDSMIGAGDPLDDCP